MKRSVNYLHIRAMNGRSTRGILACGGITVPCALGRSGRSHLKREGDGASPVGIFALRKTHYRPDKLKRPRTGLGITPLRGLTGWCEKPGDRNYNREVKLPYRGAHEDMKRQDDLYDIVVTTSHNERPRVQNLGSAIFFHLARPGYSPTAGCIAVSRADMLKLLPYCSRRTRLVIWPPGNASPTAFRK
jgi:L,D-peptidoglycan transpeptidase YkuD (ErfK/YbiS/YcfS/YnhG family)